MRRAVFAIILSGLVALVVVGLSQSREAHQVATGSGPNAAQAARRLAGSPPALAALHGQAGRILDGGPAAYRARVRALRGHPVVVNLWASWCGPCRIEFPIFQRAAADFGRRVAFLGLSVQNSRVDAAAFLRQHPIAYPTYRDPDGDIAAKLGAAGLPTTAFYDARGKLVDVHSGPYESLSDLRADLRRYASA